MPIAKTSCAGRALPRWRQTIDTAIGVVVGESCDLTRFSIQVANTRHQSTTVHDIKHFHWCYELVVAIQLRSHRQLGLRLRLITTGGGIYTTSNFTFPSEHCIFFGATAWRYHCWGTHESEAKKCLLLLHYFRSDAMRWSVVTITAALSLSCHVFPRTRYPFTLFWFVRKHWDGMGWN
jgi:hypothetical protein